jgi:1-acyl-sn-glycerol-3-phosphate acyltransferase
MPSKETHNADAAGLAAALIEETEGLLQELRPQPPAVTLDSDIDHELGLDSLSRVELGVRLEQRFAVHLPSELFLEADTPRHLLREILTARHMPSPLPVAQVMPAEPAAPGSVPEQAVTLPELLRWHASIQPDRPHIHLLKGGREERMFSYRQLLDEAQAAAIGLQARGIQPGDRVALMLPTGGDYFVSFFAILLCAAVPVPIYPPMRRSQIPEHLRRHAGILRNSGASLLITVAEARPLARLLQSSAEPLRGVLTLADLLDHERNAVYGEPALTADDVAFLQYTSGSTGNPKGVILSHGDLLSNIRAMGKAIDARPDDVFVSWLPLYHDMGLIGAWLGSLYYGIPLVIMSPIDFLGRPLRWLQTIQRYGGTLSASPNFGYELCLKRIPDEEAAQLDLSSWRCAFNGAEPVSPLTIERFSKRFAPAGFRPEAMMPVYGLAEAAVGLAFPSLEHAPRIDAVDRRALSERGQAWPADKDDETALRFPSCGPALPGYHMRIVDEEGHELPERRQGRLEFTGPSATRGYFDNPELSEQIRDGEWLDTGDLGYLVDGEIYLTGRIKDMIIRAGRNLYPHELEEAVGDLAGIRKGCVVAFGSTDPESGTERLVVVAESRESDTERQEQLRQRITEITADLSGTPPEVVMLVPPHTVLKTSSGKIRRGANREAFEQGDISHPAARPRLGLLHLALAALPGMLRQWLRRMAERGFAAWAWLVFWVLAPLTWLSVALLPRRSWRFALSRVMARALAMFTGTPLEVAGLKNLPPADQPCVMVVNHASYLDGPVLIATVPNELIFIAKEELAHQFVAGTYLRRMGAEFVERFDPRRGLSDLQRITRIGRTGRTLLFFAEGTFSAIPGLRPFYMGGFVSAMEAQLPVVPVAIAGTRSILRSGSWYPYRGRIKVTIGEPLQPPPLSQEPSDNWRAALQLRDAARRHILAHCGEPDLVRGAEVTGPEE